MKKTKKIIKGIIGIVSLIHFMPGALIVYMFFKGTIDEIGYLTLYIIGLKIDAVVILILSMFLFIYWCLSDKDGFWYA